nr:Uncharacterised protein [Ipomoea batatas]
MDVVQPSPAISFVFAPACLTNLTPTFSKGSSSSICLRTVSPSLTILGGPYLFSKTTFLPFGPKVTPTRSATRFTPACTFSVAEPSWLKYNSLAIALAFSMGLLEILGNCTLVKEIAGDFGFIKHPMVSTPR